MASLILRRLTLCKLRTELALRRSQRCERRALFLSYQELKLRQVRTTQAVSGGSDELGVMTGAAARKKVLCENPNDRSSPTCW